MTTHAEAFADVLERLVIPYLPKRRKPVVREAAPGALLTYSWDYAAAWGPVVNVPSNFGIQPDGVYVHEDGHAAIDWTGWWRPGGATRAIAEFLAFLEADQALAYTGRIVELWAEHYAHAFVANYAGPSDYAPLVAQAPFRDRAATRAFFITCDEEAWAMARMAPRVVAIPVDANGDSTKPGGVLVTSISGLKPGVEAHGIATRVGFTGAEAAIGDFSFATDTAGQAWGRVHARGAKGGGTVYVMVSASQ